MTQIFCTLFLHSSSTLYKCIYHTITIQQQKVESLILSLKMAYQKFSMNLMLMFCVVAIMSNLVAISDATRELKKNPLDHEKEVKMGDEKGGGGGAYEQYLNKNYEIYYKNQIPLGPIGWPLPPSPISFPFGVPFPPLPFPGFPFPPFPPTNIPGAALPIPPMKLPAVANQVP